MMDLALSVLFVPRCAACDRRVAPGEALCAPCAISLEALGVACPRCAEPCAGPVPVVCARCHRRPPPFETLVAPWRYGAELATALRRMKLDRVPEIGRELAPLVAPFLAAAVGAGAIDVIVPVPLHWRRLAARGFNQAQVLADEAARFARLDVPVDGLSLRRIRATPSQTGLDAAARVRNVARAFEVAPRRVTQIADRRVLLLDDIATTGATLAAASRALLRAGAAGVVAFAIARAGD
jgi:ComF family protein